MRRLFWPAIATLTLTAIALFASVYRVTYTSPTQNTYIALQSWSLTVWNGAFIDDPDHGLFNYFAQGLDAALVYSHPNWNVEWIWNENILMPGARRTTHAPAIVRKAGVPLIYVLGLACVLSALPIRAGLIHRRRVKQGACLTCGYDLSGIDTDSPCPECGSKL